MSSISNPKSFLDLYTDLMNRVRVDTTESATKVQAQRYINIALNDMHINFGEKFPWAERNSVLQVMAPYSTGTVAITKGSTALVGTSTLWNTAHDFGANNTRVTGKIVIAGTQNVYTISSVDSDTGITLNERYQDTTQTTGSYEYYEDEYALASDFLRPFDVQYFTSNIAHPRGGRSGAIPIIGRLEFRRNYPRNKTTGQIEVATIVDRQFNSSTTPVRHIIFFRPPSKFQLIPYNYITSNLAVTAAGVEQADLINDTDEPIVPFHYRHVIVFGALYHWYRDKKNDTRSSEAKQEYSDLIVRIASDTEIGASKPTISPKMSAYRNRRVLRQRTTRHTLGSSFDEIR